MEETQKAIELVNDHLMQLYIKLSEGSDVSPRERFHLKGQMDLLVELNIIDSQSLRKMIEDVYQSVFACKVDASFWKWSEAVGYCMIPVFMKEAPVYKGKQAD